MKNVMDKKVLDLIEIIKSKKKEIKKLENYKWKTNCVVFNNNLKTIDSVKTLIGIYADILAKYNSYNEASALLNVSKAPEFTFENFCISDWCDDISMRIQKIEIQTKFKKLEELEARLDKIISPELKAELELNKILEDLND